MQLGYAPSIALRAAGRIVAARTKVHATLGHLHPWRQSRRLFVSCLNAGPRSRRQVPKILVIVAITSIKYSVVM
jgi:hypothetical protein